MARAGFYRVCDWIERTFITLGVILFMVMTAAVFYEVVARYVFNAPTFWSEALARYSMIWIVTLGLAVGIRRQQNIYVDFVARQFPDGAQTVLAWMRFGFVLAFASVLAVYGAQHALANINQTVTGLNIPAFFVYLCVPIAGVGMLAFVTELILKGERGFF